MDSVKGEPDEMLLDRPTIFDCAAAVSTLRAAWAYFTQPGYVRMYLADAFHSISKNEKTFLSLQDIVINQMSRIQSVLSLNIDNNKIADFDVVFGPSGSDMMYIPLLFKSFTPC